MKNVTQLNSTEHDNFRFFYNIQSAPTPSMALIEWNFSEHVTTILIPNFSLAQNRSTAKHSTVHHSTVQNSWRSQWSFCSQSEITNMLTCGSIMIGEIFVISTKTFKITSRSKSRIYPLEQMSYYDSRRKCPNFKNIAECRNHSTKTPEDNTTHYTKTQILRKDLGCAAYFIDFSIVYGVWCVVYCVG